MVGIEMVWIPHCSLEVRVVVVKVDPATSEEVTAKEEFHSGHQPRSDLVDNVTLRVEIVTNPVNETGKHGVQVTDFDETQYFEKHKPSEDLTLSKLKYFSRLSWETIHGIKDKDRNVGDSINEKLFHKASFKEFFGVSLKCWIIKSSQSIFILRLSLVRASLLPQTCFFSNRGDGYKQHIDYQNHGQNSLQDVH